MTAPVPYRYNYILYNLNGDFIRAAFMGLVKLQNVKICDGALGTNSRLLNLLHKLHWSNKVNRIIRLPFKGIWFQMMYTDQFPNNHPICFIYLGGKYAIDDYGLTSYVRKRNVHNRQVIVFGDLISKKGDINLDETKRKVDLLITYDKAEAEKYGIVYHPLNALSPVIEVTEPAVFETDVFFIGYAKDRYDEIIAVYRALIEKEFRCDFLVAGVEKSLRIQGKGLQYLEKVMPYAESVRRMNKAKCILEIVQHGSSGATIRTREAVVYKRKLLTNAQFILDDVHFNPKQMSVFISPEDIDFDFLKSPMDYAAFESGDDLSPENLLKFCEEHFSEKEVADARQGS